jgi:hypothetical protein
VLASDGADTGLDLVIEPDAEPAPSVLPSKGLSPKEWLLRQKKRGGFTEEEALFRMRWGWEAFAEAEKSASETPLSPK